ncbi:MAG TPA: phosphohydrolase [Cyanobacteria bacterium UBA8803]|nr:phosphohydrolase [Cyanobacteria bacterium UBA9273]HBL60779.1 phosphohydrolase [Cyanobacteria bacterium UBA8803]
MTTGITQQIQFIIEIDKLKSVLRQTRLTDNSRQENSAEHSWHLAIMAIVLTEYAPPNVDLFRAIKMLLLHDLVEIDAGDTFCYDLQGNQDRATREQIAATRIFGMLPPEQGQQLREIWEEFEAFETATARFAAALDRLQPLLQNQQNQGQTWQLHGINQNQVMQRMAPVKDGIPGLWPMVEQIVEDCVAAGYLPGIRDEGVENSDWELRTAERINR